MHTYFKEIKEKVQYWYLVMYSVRSFELTSSFQEIC